MMRDSLQNYDIDWARLQAACVLVHSHGHEVAVSVAPHVRTTLPYANPADTRFAFWIPARIGYSFKYKNITLQAGICATQVWHLTTGTTSQRVSFTASGEYRFHHDSHCDASLFVDGQYSIIYGDEEFEVVDALAMTYVLAGLRVRFR